MLFLKEFWKFTELMAPYLILGLTLAGLVHELIPDNFIKKHLGTPSFSSILKAVAFGIPLPLCSCSVIPFINSLKRKGANVSSTLAFTIATPITGIDSILATYGVLGLWFAVLRVIASTAIAIAAGVLGNLFVKELEKGEETGCCSCSCSLEPESKGFSFKSAISYGFVKILGDISKPLFYGLVIGALVSTFADNHLRFIFSGKIESYLTALILSVPIYVCATSSIPIAASLILAGAPAGAAFIFLSSGPATNATSISVVRETLGTKATVVYLISVVSGSLLFGALIDLTFSNFNVNPQSIVNVHKEFGFIDHLSGATLIALMLYHLTKRALYLIN